MKKLICGVLILCLLSMSALAAGILPSLDDLLTDELPSMTNALLRKPDNTQTYDNGDQLQVYRDVTREDYDRCSEYLGGLGCVANASRTSEKTMVVELSCAGHSFTMRYDAKAQILEMVYPKGTAPSADEIFRVGSIAVFGKYQGELIEWLVLDNNGNEATMISLKGIDAMPYNTEYAVVNWESCKLNDWLNTNFMANLSAEEHDRMVRDGQDYVRLLTIDEAERYFAGNEGRICQPTSYAVKQGVTAYNSKAGDAGTCQWWLKSDDKSGTAPAVVEDGSINEFGYDVGSKKAVRPVITLKIYGEFKPAVIGQ